MPTPEDAKAKAATTYNAAADFYDHAANSFWDRFGRRTIDRLSLKSKARVLDVCCGSGASAIPAAEMVGAEGYVLGVDLAENLLELARTKANNLGLKNVKFRVGDMLDLQLPASDFDAVVCVFGIFFVPDMSAAVRELWRLVRPGGKLAVTTWGPKLFEPANGAFWDAVRQARPDLYKGFNPWDRISDPPAVRALLAEGGAVAADVVAESGSHFVARAEDWWSTILGSGYRGTLEQMTPEERDHVRGATLTFLTQSAVQFIEANVVYAAATKPGSA